MTYASLVLPVFLAIILLAPFATSIPCMKVKGLEPIAQILSFTMNPLVFLLIMGILSVYLYYSGFEQYLIPLVGGVLLLLVVGAFKCLFHSPRPLERPKGPCDISALGYPSGHTAEATWTSLQLYEIIHNPLIFLYSAAVGWSRVELCKHYPIDVLGGFLTALLVYFVIT